MFQKTSEDKKKKKKKAIHIFLLKFITETTDLNDFLMNKLSKENKNGDGQQFHQC